MRRIIKETLLVLAMIIVANILLIEFGTIDQALLNEATKILLISLCIQPWVIYQFNN